MSDSDLLLRKARHEAGHAVMAYKVRYPRTRPVDSFLETTIKGEGKTDFGLDRLSAVRVDDGAWLPEVSGKPVNVERFVEEVENDQLAICGGSAAEILFYGDAAVEHANDHSQLAHWEWWKRKVQGLLPPTDDDRAWIQELIGKAKDQLDTPKWKALIDAVARRLIEHERLKFGQFVGIAVEQFGSEELPEQVFYFARVNDGPVWTARVEYEGKALDSVPVLLTERDDSYSFWCREDFPEVREGCDRKMIDGRPAILDFLRDQCARVDYMTIDPNPVEGQLHAVCVNRISDLVGRVHKRLVADVLATSTVVADLSITVYGEKVLEIAQERLASDDYDMAIVMANAACEAATERVLLEFFGTRQIQYLRKFVWGFFDRSGFRLRNDRIHALYRAFTNDDVNQCSWWQEYADMVKQRDAIVHAAKQFGKNEAVRAVEVAGKLIAHLKQQAGL